GNIDRVRPILHSALLARWSQLVGRPIADPDRPFPHAALIIDGHSTECFRPRGRYEEVKHYFDGKNRIYALKTEVAIAAHRPHFFVTSCPHYAGSTHDYAMHKREYRRYLPYLRKHQAEAGIL